VRFLIDSCAGRRLADWLRAEGHDVLRVTDAGADPGDVAILRRSVDEGRVLVTMDKDFGALIHRANLAHAGLIRLPHVPAAERIRLMQAVLSRHAAADLRGAIVTVRGTRIRILRRADAP
jgi:predicted nuclease of predicted toxin-antitoxin system